MKAKFAGTDADKRLVVWCPGCDEPHLPRVQGPNAWTFNGNLTEPTLEPSIKVTHGDGRICHSFLRQGMWQFLEDSTHMLAGKTVPLPDLPESWTEE